MMGREPSPWGARRRFISIWRAVRHPHDADDRSDVPDEIEIEICVERGVDRARGVYLEKRIAIGGCLHDRLGTDIAAGTRPVLDDEWLAEPFRKPLTHQARENVGRPTGGKTDDDAHQARRIGLRPSEARHRPRPDAEIACGGEVSSRPPSSLRLSCLEVSVDRPYHLPLTKQAIAQSSRGKGLEVCFWP